MQFSNSICIAQLIRMSQCAPEAILKPKRFEFTTKTVITNVFVAQVYWEAVPNTRLGSSKASVAKCVVRAWNSARSVGGRAELTSWTLGPSETKCMSSAKYGGAWPDKDE